MYCPESAPSHTPCTARQPPWLATHALPSAMFIHTSVTEAPVYAFTVLSCALSKKRSSSRSKVAASARRALPPLSSREDLNSGHASALHSLTASTAPWPRDSAAPSNKPTNAHSPEKITTCASSAGLRAAHDAACTSTCAPPGVVCSSRSRESNRPNTAASAPATARVEPKQFPMAACRVLRLLGFHLSKQRCLRCPRASCWWRLAGQ
mmetsp:Transcript_16977/g.43518  ORF Transcript_16977/g.43518 Transcript_16977/m.43518 type:complete len:208 (+) Transcript_16977:139-762(+)